MVGLDRLELSTSRLSGVRSNHLSYRPDLALGNSRKRNEDGDTRFGFILSKKTGYKGKPS